MKAHEDVQPSNSSQLANNTDQSSTVHHSQQDPDLKTQSAESTSQQNANSASDQTAAAQKAERALESPGKRIDVLG